MTKNQKKVKSGDTWEWEETEETRKAVAKLHQTIQQSNLESTASDYGVGK